MSEPDFLEVPCLGDGLLSHPICGVLICFVLFCLCPGVAAVPTPHPPWLRGYCDVREPSRRFWRELGAVQKAAPLFWHGLFDWTHVAGIRPEILLFLWVLPASFWVCKVSFRTELLNMTQSYSSRFDSDLPRCHEGGVGLCDDFGSSWYPVCIRRVPELPNG